MKGYGIAVAACVLLAATVGATANTSEPATRNGTPGMIPGAIQSGATKAADNKEQAIRLAREIIPSIQLPCEVTDAYLVSQGKMLVNRHNVDTKNLEVECQNGMGYLIRFSPPEKTLGDSCFAADKYHATNSAAAACMLPVNADVKTAAGTVLGKLGVTCQATGVNWFGVNAGNDYTEIACAGGNGYVLASPVPGLSTTPVSAMSCVDAVKHGIVCKLPNNGAPVVTLAALTDALVQNKVVCNAADIHVAGKEKDLKRYVVEFQCRTEHPEGLVAMIPLQDSKAPFETLSCAQAASKYKVACTFVKQ